MYYYFVHIEWDPNILTVMPFYCETMPKHPKLRMKCADLEQQHIVHQCEVVALGVVINIGMSVAVLDLHALELSSANLGFRSLHAVVFYVARSSRPPAF